MNFLLDTCMLSEARKPAGREEVRQWLRQVAESRLYISTLTLGEIGKGIARLGDRSQARTLPLWLEQDLVTRFQGGSCQWTARWPWSGVA